MKEEITESLNIIKEACASVMADLVSHQKIQNAIATIEAELSKPADSKPAK